MTFTTRPFKRKALKTLPQSAFQSTALLLQGGGALGAYQAGVYEALASANILPDWVGGISMGAINGAIIVGNKPADRVKKLRTFWETLTNNPLWNQYSALNPFIRQGGDRMRSLWNQVSAGLSMFAGIKGFFVPHTAPWLAPSGSPSATSFYDTKVFRKTLEKFIDFNLLNAGDVRYTTNAVNINTGNYTIFDNQSQEIGPEHVMASGALPPALPAVEIEGQYYWDGGLISNTPLHWVMDEAKVNTLIFQVDLWSATGEIPKDIMEVMMREKEIQYSSRTRSMTNRFKHAQKMRHAFAALYKKLPPELKNTDEAQLLFEDSDTHVYNIVHLIYRARQYEGYSKDYEFSRKSMEEHWKAGYNDTIRSLRHKEILELPTCPEGIMTYDVAQN